MSNVYAGLGNGGRKLYLYEADRNTKVRQILWGDWLKVDGEEADGWLRIVWSPKTNPRMLFIPKADTVANRPLEIVFLDVGQGDGAVLITPEDHGVLVAPEDQGGDADGREVLRCLKGHHVLEDRLPGAGFPGCRRAAG